MTKRKQLFYRIIGPILLMSALWVGPYAYSLEGVDHWTRFPTVITTIITAAIGYVLICFGYMSGKAIND